MKKNILILAVCTFALFSCTNEEDFKVNKNDFQTVEINGMVIENQNGTLAFENESQLKMALDKLSETSITEDDVAIRAKLSTSDKNDFHSLHDIFTEAMEEAENYYDRKGGYEEFKEKYSALYFPEEGSDYSAYLPVCDENIAYFLNEEGNIIIGNEMKNLKDISNYQQLVDLERTFPEEDVTSDSTSIQLRSSWVGPTYNCHGGDRRIWIKSNTSKKGDLHVRNGYYCIHVEVCFRKKGFLGQWYNYSSTTTLELPEYVMNDKAFKVTKSGTSSHDYYVPYCPVNRISIIDVVGWGTVTYLGEVFPVYVRSY